MRRSRYFSPFYVDHSYSELMSDIERAVEDGGEVPCLKRENDPDWWHSDEKRYEHRARVLCMSCPVQTGCFEYAARAGEHGIWGGADLSERMAARRLVASRPQQREY